MEAFTLKYAPFQARREARFFGGTNKRKIKISVERDKTVTIFFILGKGKLT
jgi:hypothetical protein